MNTHFFKFASVLFLGSILFQFGCTRPDTEIYEKGPIQTGLIEKGLRNKIVITDETVILDARPPFEFAMVHAPGAFNLQWTDFVQQKAEFPGRLKVDVTSEIRRLALMGMAPKTPILIVGDGTAGKGEEGRLAWTLMYLGFQNIQTAKLDSLGLRYSNVTPPPRANVPVWTPQPVKSLDLSKNLFLRMLKGPRQQGLHILDVRSKNEYFSKDRNFEYQYPEFGAVHIEWKEFYTADGRPNLHIRDQLRAINIGLNDQIVVISNNGVRSGAVTYALLALGFDNVTNFSGGYTELLSR